MSTRTADTLRILSADMVQKANSGHPGLPMGMADCAAVLWTRHLVHDPQHPEWPGRDRFVLSAGHGSALLYALLHLSGYDLDMEALRNFRQWHSGTPGHPECKIPGVETTTGPLGQGLANAAGMALAAEMSAARWNTPEYRLFGAHYVYCFCSDGDLMEGISHEASSLAGHLGLGRLICFYDSNDITIDGSTELSCSDDPAKRFEAYHWHVQSIDGHDREAIDAAIRNAQKETGKPSMIIARTHIAYGSPHKKDSASAHGAPLGEEELRETKKNLGFPEDEHFYVPAEVRKTFSAYRSKLQKQYAAWEEDFKAWRRNETDKYEHYRRQCGTPLPPDLEEKVLASLTGKDNSTRAHSGNILQLLAEEVPGLIGGSADLAGSNKTDLKEGGEIRRRDFTGKNLHFGIREFAMAGILSGISLYGNGFIPFGGTFVVFSDYMRSAVRLAALMRRQVVFVLTHDSIFVGEDGPTHQPVEQVMSLRLIPNLQVIRPAGEEETARAWLSALRRSGGPTALILSRQKCPEPFRGKEKSAGNFDKGGYIVMDSKADPDLIMAGSGSELSLCYAAAEKLREEDSLDVRVLSLPSLETFLRQEDAYRHALIPPGETPVAVVEAGVTLGWGNLSDNPTLLIGRDAFGDSAPHTVLAEKYGFTAEKVYRRVRDWMGAGRR